MAFDFMDYHLRCQTIGHHRQQQQSRKIMAVAMIFNLC